MIKEELKTKVDQCFKDAEKMLIENGYVMPMLIVEFIDSEDKKANIAVAIADLDKTKRDKFIGGLGVVMAGLERITKIKGINCIIMMTEAWFSTPSNVEYKLKKGNIKPSEDPNKREMIMAVGLTPDNVISMTSKEIFSVEVKGKRHFTLNDVPEMSKESKNLQTGVLDKFYEGYKFTLKNDAHDKFIIPSSEEMKHVSLEFLMPLVIKTLIKQVGGIDGEIINKK